MIDWRLVLEHVNDLKNKLYENGLHSDARKMAVLAYEIELIILGEEV